MANRHSLIYVTRDIERALGMEPSESFGIITNSSIYAETIANQHPNHVSLIDSPTGKGFSTAKLLTLISDNKPSFLTANSLFLVFKNTSEIEKISSANGYTLLNPPAELSERVENKIRQIEWLGELGQKYLPPHKISPAKNIKWQDSPFILQWSHGHTGSGTALIRSEQELIAVKNKFPERIARQSDFVDGPVFTVNVIAAKNGIFFGNISYQITGLIPFTDNNFSTVGNDWGIVKKLLRAEDIQGINNMALELGGKLGSDGWKGLFGIDVIKDKNDKLYLIEINARQPASTTYESFLQKETGKSGITIFEAHIGALLGEDIQDQIIPIDNGAQIVQRLTKIIKNIPAEKLLDIIKKQITTLKLSGYTTIQYSNTEENTDLIRIQTERSFMDDHNKLNSDCEEVKSHLGSDEVCAPPDIFGAAAHAL